MARVMREVVVCDVCGGEADVSSVTVAVDGTEQGSELCAAHRGRLREAVARVLAVNRRRRSAAACRGAPARAVDWRWACRTSAATSRPSTRGRRSTVGSPDGLRRFRRGWPVNARRSGGTTRRASPIRTLVVPGECRNQL